MTVPIIHPNWAVPARGLTDGYSIEITAKDVSALREAAPAMPVDTPVAVTFLPGELQGDRIAAAVAVRALGFEPMPHFSARRLVSVAEFEDYLGAVVEQAQVRRCFVVAGDPPEPQGPFFDSMALIDSGAFERNGIKAVGVGGHPEGHPVMSPEQCWQVLDAKIAAITARGMAPLVVTQFGFDPDALLGWLAEARVRGIDAPVRIGVPGPAGIKRLIAFAARCGVGASASVLKKYGISLGNLLGSAGPDRLLDAFAAGLGEEHGRVRLHFYPFGGVGRTVEWIGDYERRHGLDRPR
ncbi:methylenetetrahydrofolate reductase [Novosphingobium flavum]|uniref:Methylenetetrahydrofolate reductase n=1 Tax=Novosphingobium aerophilum TaxID=2839843 RepID=A0A7X1FAR7_9SPHN|nr:methylenetetrahydrofolate reductase [Novosphingobium aerophilum]MBC2653550.1 methylenetetrahydrofolate reductase [Novosphingobium aerophilum]MBC2663365.1 methylenetetrahydrofolate reductase [Novosphingobium aerophilum]